MLWGTFWSKPCPVTAQGGRGCHSSGVLIGLFYWSQPSESPACRLPGRGLFQGHLVGTGEDDWHVDCERCATKLDVSLGKPVPVLKDREEERNASWHPVLRVGWKLVIMGPKWHVQFEASDSPNKQTQRRYKLLIQQLRTPAPSHSLSFSPISYHRYL